VPDSRSHRGAHQDDARFFALDALPTLRRATSDLCWLLSRSYVTPSALKLVGDRYALSARQRTAVSRCACSDGAARQRELCRVLADEIAGCEVWIDGYNVLTTLEAALGGGVILLACDGCFRDMASMHGSYRKVEETVPALQLIGEFTASRRVASLHWLLDSPVSNSGRLKAIIRELANHRGWAWEVSLVANPDKLLVDCEHVVASADSAVLDCCRRWVNLARPIIAERVPHANIVDFNG
jgi:hypothetical protein